MTREEVIDIIRKNIPHLGIGATEMTEALNELIPELRESEGTKELRFCIEYINPCFPLLDNGELNVRHLRVPDEHWAEMAITLILSFGGKIYALYRGNVKDGKLADWPTPMIVDSEDWFTDEWLHELMDCGHNCL